MRHALLTLALLGSAVPAAAQTPFTGRWKLNYPVGARIENGVATTTFGTGTLTFEMEGDSLIGTLTADPSANGTPRPAQRLAGKATGGTAVLISRREGAGQSNGQEHAIIVVSTWQFTVRADTLDGTVQRTIEGHDVPPQAPGRVTGTRQRP